jgi:beta-1,4-mannosyl-glycoprotein beta-1,4-N-acetylglucosaminyltransferase
MTKIYDCFCYFNEDLLLQLRFETLWDHVDFFIISEATYTQVGKPKPLNFDIEKFSKYKSKIRYLVVDHFPPGEQGAWKNENYQRSFLINGLHDAEPNDLILVSDLDEIPRPEKILEYDPKRYLRGDFNQRNYNYLMNNLSVESDNKPSVWFGTNITTFQYLKEFFHNVNSVRSYKSSGIFRSIKRTLFKKFKTQPIMDGGWHFSWVTSPELIMVKMNSIAEQEFIKDEFRTLEYITSKIYSGQDLLGRPIKYVYQPIVEPDFPKYLCDNIELFSKVILPDNRAHSGQ